MKINPSEIPVVILAGGKGLFIDDSGQRVAKGNVLVNNRPLIYYVIKSYVNHGFQEFIINGSYQLDKTFQFLKELIRLEAVSEDLYSGDVGVNRITIRFINTGVSASTGSRLRAIRSLLDKREIFSVTYSDTISDIDLSEALKFYIESNQTATLAAVRLPTRFRILGIRSGEDQIRGFGKAFLRGHFINGGFYFFNKGIWSEKYLGNKIADVLETSVLDALVENADISAFQFEGDWQHMDCERDIEQMSLIAGRL